MPKEVKMRIIMSLLCSLMFVVSAQAQSFSSSTLSSITGGFNGTFAGPPLLTDLVLVNRLNPGNAFSTAGLPLTAFASAVDVQNLNARIDQTFQLMNARVDQLNANITQLERGVAAAIALTGASMPSAPGRTTWAINGAAFQSEVGGGISLAYRLNFSTPIAVTAAYGNGGGTAHVGRIGLMGEF